MYEIMVQNDTICLYGKTYSNCATNCPKMPLQHSMQCSDKRIQDSNCDCTLGMRTANDMQSVLYSANSVLILDIISYILLIFWECILQKAIVGIPSLHAWNCATTSIAKKTMQEGVAHGKSGKLSHPTLICIGNMGKLWPHIAHIHLGHRGKVVCKVENKGSLVDCGAILWPLRSATMQQVHLVAWCFAKPRT